MSAPSAFILYCDDVRREADGRPSLMGIYPTQAIIDLDQHKKVPKICAYTMLTIPFGGSPLESISVVSHWSETEIERVEIPSDVIDEFNAKQEQETNKKQRLSIAMVADIRDLDIGHGGALKTEVLVNGSQIQTGLLHLKPQ